MGRVAALLALAGALAGWYAAAPHLAPLALWPSVAIVSAALIPASFALVWLVLPLRRRRHLLLAATAAAITAAVALSLAGSGIGANLAKLAAMSGIGWCFLLLFEELSWVVAVACIIPWVDAYSVWRGPTKAITTHHAAVFTTLSVAFVTPGGTARLGLPDIMFFAVFLGASERFGLRPRATWLAMTAGLGLTMVLTTIWAVNGLPALPAISLGFLAPNADRLWHLVVRDRQPLGVSSG